MLEFSTRSIGFSLSKLFLFSPRANFPKRWHKVPEQMPPSSSRSPRTTELCKRNPHGRSRSSESRLMLKSKNDEDVDDLLLFAEMKKHESESSEEITHFSARRGDSLKASDGGKNEYNWLFSPPGTPMNGADREPKPINNRRTKTRTRTDTPPRRSMNGKARTSGAVATTHRDAKREPCRRSSSGNINAKEKRNGIVCVGGTNSHPSAVEEVPLPAKGASEQTFGEAVDTSKLEKACEDANLKSAAQKWHFEKDVLDQNAHVCVTKSEAAAALSKTAEALRGAPRNFASEEAAADAILQCNSIVRDLVNESTAVGSENQTALTEISHPSLEQLVKSYVYYKRYKNLQRFNRKRQEFDIKKVLGELGTDAKTEEHVKPLKVESKCNCSIM